MERFWKAIFLDRGFQKELQVGFAKITNLFLYFERSAHFHIILGFHSHLEKITGPFIFSKSMSSYPAHKIRVFTQNDRQFTCIG